MKKTLSLITILLCIMQAAFSQAPELKNIMPNSYQKLTRLSETEERAFMESEAAIKAVSAIDNYHIRQKPLSELHYQVFAETDCGLQFYRLLVSASPLEAAYTAEYRSKTITADECLRMQTGGGTVFQIVFLRTKTNALQNIGVFPYAQFWASQGEDEGFTFNDLMIKPLNEDEIGFFVTEVNTGFVADRRKWDENRVKIDYYFCKNQIAAYNRTCFSKYRIDESITSASKDSISIQASDCLFDPKCPFKYSIQNAFDGDPATSYVENTEDDLMKISFPGYGKEYSDNFTVSIINGYSLNENLYIKNNRVKEISVVGYELNDIKTELIERIPKILKFEDKKLSFQVLSFDFTCFGPFYFKVSGIYSGNTYNDTCIAELNFKDDKKWFFGDL